MHHNALSNMTNGEVLFIKDNKIVGKGKHYASRGDSVGVVVTSGEFYDYLNNHSEMIPLKNSSFEGLKHFPMHFSEMTGGYLSINFKDFSEIDEYLEDISCVSEFGFRWGMVPEMYSSVPGYRSAIED